jgi:hypothetical protein
VASWRRETIEDGGDVGAIGKAIQSKCNLLEKERLWNVYSMCELFRAPSS